MCMVGITFFAQCNSRPGPAHHLTNATLDKMIREGKDYWLQIEGVKGDRNAFDMDPLMGYVSKKSEPAGHNYTHVLVAVAHTVTYTKSWPAFQMPWKHVWSESD